MEKEETKIVNLCEDMNPHKHDKKSYEKMVKDQNVKTHVKREEKNEDKK